MHSLRLLLDLVPIVLVESRGVPGPRCSPPVISLDRRFARREEARTPRRLEQQHERVPMPHDSQLLKNVPEGLEPCAGDC